jgi:hypothetical protein
VEWALSAQASRSPANDLDWLLQVVAGRRHKDVTIVDRPFENGNPLDHMGNQQIAIDRATEVPAS